ncbi:hypothetical protein HPB51_014104 [Rhipicephalus microplus]|uniref:DDE-1 domain-containing protein n=1 Tax=Rhipicephalus microplus TaxID=6941 RepID=A0A9J6DUJ7_RHIMP|nr:hypothetical protein HPB51_014104 [Rhipicephalus microplus]
MLPCRYDFNKKAWMISAIFTKFLQQLDKKMGAKARKIILFVDNAPCHPPDMTCLWNIKVVFLPPNRTSCLELLDARIIKYVKHGQKAACEASASANEVQQGGKDFSA